MDLHFVEKGLVNGSGKRHRAIWTDIADTSDPVGKLRSCRHWPRSRRATEKRDKLAAGAHSITSSARASSVGGISMPSARAVGRLMTNWNLVDCTTGRSAGLAPLRMRPV